jgi:hypothetical protein
LVGEGGVVFFFLGAKLNGLSLQFLNAFFRNVVFDIELFDFFFAFHRILFNVFEFVVLERQIRHFVKDFVAFCLELPCAVTLTLDECLMLFTEPIEAVEDLIDVTSELFAFHFRPLLSLKRWKQLKEFRFLRFLFGIL